ENMGPQMTSIQPTLPVIISIGRLRMTRWRGDCKRGGPVRASLGLTSQEANPTSASTRQVFPKHRVEAARQAGGGGHRRVVAARRFPQDDTRSEERRVGKEGR